MITITGLMKINSHTNYYTSYFFYKFKGEIAKIKLEIKDFFID